MNSELRVNLISKLYKKLLNFRNAGLIIFIIILWILLSILSPFFLKNSNIMVLLLQASTVMICGIGQSIVILSGGADLSVGAVAALAGMMVGIAITNWHWGFLPSILLGSVVGIIVGLLNGTLIGKFRIQPMVCTLGTMSIARGLTLIVTSGRSIFVINPIINKVGNGNILGIPIPVIIAFSIFFVGYIVITYTNFGRNVYAIGGNEEATRLSGINVNLNKVFIYSICGLCAAIVGIILVCTLGASEPTVGVGFELDSIAVTAIGGTSLLGGIGSLVGTIFGALLIGTIKNGLTILNIVSYYQQLIIGVVIILAVLLEDKRR